MAKAASVYWHGIRINIRMQCDNIEILMQHADKVMYRAKNAGRNRSFTYAEHQADIAAANSAVG